MLLTVSRGMDSFIQFCTVLVIFVAVLAVTLAATKWIAKVQGGRRAGINIEVIETYGLAPNKYVQIVRTGEKYLAIAVCRDTVTMLAEIPAEQILILEKSENTTLDFNMILEKAKVLHHDRKSRRNK